MHPQLQYIAAAGCRTFPVRRGGQATADRCSIIADAIGLVHRFASSPLASAWSVDSSSIRSSLNRYTSRGQEQVILPGKNISFLRVRSITDAGTVKND